ncbi:peptidase domain-containing ABC transporter [Janthinobacterium sp. LB2P49]|uniref:peptidase domain-containing ABC transporter n=1 Tax=Janthinobacterium sp. LB2P49 TaxID=3424198 RepID=UPI003F255DCF
MEKITKSEISHVSFLWAIQAMCALHNHPFSEEIVENISAAPYNMEKILKCGADIGLEINGISGVKIEIHKLKFPCLLININKTVLKQIELEEYDEIDNHEVILVLNIIDEQALIAAPGNKETFIVDKKYIKIENKNILFFNKVLSTNIESENSQDAKFGFSWFLPELLRHKKIWKEILLASLVIQIIALATPLFTQTIIDKVIVHRTQSTLIVVLVGMTIFMFFSAIISWVRQYLILHTGNKVDAMLGTEVFDHLLKLPPNYFQSRPTGVIAARLHGIETIREFISSAAITLMLDLPFLIIFAAIMFYYSIKLTIIVVAILLLIVLISLLTSPLFQKKLQLQFQLGARNQAFLTEYISGMETVKSLQLESQLGSKYSNYLSSYLSASFSMKQLANTYNTSANLLEQLMTLAILGLGAYTVMNNADFTIGMLIAFQMFASKLSQPMLKLVGLWQQFQQASLSIKRLGDLMDAPTEHYSTTPARSGRKKGAIQIRGISFKYNKKSPLLYENLSFNILPGEMIAVMGPSGSGKSTLAKIMLGFYRPTSGSIKIDDIDIVHLSVNELRNNFGVVPQETTLFSGTIFENLSIANPRCNLEQVIAACKMAEIHSTIEGLPKGYQTEIGERGAGLSGGQKQRIAIARALLKRPSILIFDEATSALDSETAENFSRTINNLKGKVTILFITHGLPKGISVDRIFQL